jgi:three-Cys-motif partner protein
MDHEDYFKTYREHTAIKHAILKDYLGAWMGILGSWNEKIAYIDGFCGPGFYQVGDITHDGSPIIALKIAEYFRDKTKVVCVFIDKKETYCCDLEKSIEESGFKTNYKIICGEFDQALTELLDKTPDIVPSFCFIDPFGYSGLPLSLIERFLKRPTTEAFINFMFEPISRFVSVESQHDHMDDLFGTPKWRAVIENDLRDNEREVFLRDLYHQQLSSCAKYVWPFQLKDPDRDRTIYYLFHCTNHPKGIRQMKKVMYKTGAVGTYSYQGKESSQMSLFSTEPDVKELQDFLIKEFAGTKISFDGIVDATINSPFIEKHHREALNNLKNKGLVKKVPVTTRGARGFSGKDIAVFPKTVKKKGFFF